AVAAPRPAAGRRGSPSRPYGYYALCAAIESGVGSHLVDTLRAGREWLESQDNEFARVALEYLETAPVLREPLAVNLDLADPLGNGIPLSDPLGDGGPLGDGVPLGGVGAASDPPPAPDAMQTQYLRLGDGAPHVVTGPPQPPAEQIAGGQTADALMEANRPGIAAAAYRALIDDALGTGKPDPLIMGKATLGLLTALIFDNRVGEAHSVWVDEQGPTYLGIWSLENGQTSVHDAIAYNLVAAFLHSLSTGDPNAANHAVDSLMLRNVEWAYENDPQVVPGMINSWRRHLHEIHNGEPAPEYRWHLTQAEQRWGHPIPEAGLYWMRPYRWVVDWV
ncbi:hypothetical protein, partial [Nocardia sp. NPDC004722]